MHPKLLGWVCVAVTAATFVVASFIAQSLVSGEQPQLHPFLLCYLCTSLFSLYLPIIELKRRCAGCSKRQRDDAASRHAANSSRGTMEDAEQPLLSLPQQHIVAIGSKLFPELTRLGAALKVLPVACIWFTAQFTFTLSLANTSVTSNTILSSSSSMWTLLASALVLRERITCVKLGAVTAVMAGTAMVTLADSSSSSSGGALRGGLDQRSLWGDVLCVLSAMCYSCYTVMMQRQLREDDPDVPALFFGWVGVQTAALGLPVVLGLHALGVFDLAALNPQALGLGVFNGLMDYVLGDYTWARAVLLLGSTAATLGMSVQIPVATAADVLLGHPHWMDSPRAIALTAAGTLLILAGVAGVNWSPRQWSPAPEQQQQQQQRQQQGVAVLPGEAQAS